MSGPDAVSRAEAKVRQARGRFETTLGTLQTRLNPRRVVRDAWDGAVEKGTDLAQDAAAAAREKPAIAGLAAAAVAAFIARRPLIAGVRALFHRNDAAAPPKISRRPKP